MPFTFSHPAIVLPFNLLKNKRLSLTGLVLGSMVPDFEYFIRMNSENIFGHTWDGAVWFDLPIALICTFFFYIVIRNTLISNLPHILQERLARYKQLNWNIYFKKNWKVVLLSIIIGILSHFFLDSITAENGYIANAVPFLSHMVPWEERLISVRSILHLFLSGAGLLVILYAIFQLQVPKKQRLHQPMVSYWVLMFMITIGVFMAGVIYNTNDHERTYYYLYPGLFVIIGVSALFVAMILINMLFKYRFKF